MQSKENEAVSIASRHISLYAPKRQKTVNSDNNDNNDPNSNLIINTNNNTNNNTINNANSNHNIDSYVTNSPTTPTSELYVNTDGDYSNSNSVNGLQVLLDLQQQVFENQKKIRTIN